MCETHLQLSYLGQLGVLMLCLATAAVKHSTTSQHTVIPRSHRDSHQDIRFLLDIAGGMVRALMSMEVFVWVRARIVASEISTLA